MNRFVRFAPACAFVLVLIDAWLKRVALASFPRDFSLVNPGIFALAIHENQGIAFNIPLKLPLILLVSVILGGALLRIAWQHRFTEPSISAAASLVVIGGAGNIIDRIAYSFTVDYLLFFGRSAINLSDLVILFGIGWLLIASRKHETTSDTLTTP